ncbi:MAG TPA: hypothetical protein ENG00_00240, partial [Candidatus Aenigmarchaeota archaeon]|nr:hypothetical protein [Candidatus Aenigmarchaeota archaeon]
MGAKGYSGRVEKYFSERVAQYSLYSAFDRFCHDRDSMYCRDESIPLSVSVFDIISIAMATNRKPIEIFRESTEVSLEKVFIKNVNYLAKVSIHMRKPCPYLIDNECEVYENRPLRCVQFGMLKDRARQSRDENLYAHIKSNAEWEGYPCFDGCSIREDKMINVLRDLSIVTMKENLLSDIFLFFRSPFLIDFNRKRKDVLRELKRYYKERYSINDRSF